MKFEVGDKVVVKITNEENLYTAERFAAVTAYVAEHDINCIQHISTKHAYFINDQQIEFVHQLPLIAAHTHMPEQRMHVGYIFLLKGTAADW